MKSILQISSSIHSVGGESSKLADLYVTGLLAANPKARVSSCAILARIRCRIWMPLASARS